jgi:hypothetical protein
MTKEWDDDERSLKGFTFKPSTTEDNFNLGNMLKSMYKDETKNQITYSKEQFVNDVNEKLVENAHHIYEKPLPEKIKRKKPEEENNEKLMDNEIYKKFSYS